MHHPPADVRPRSPPHSMETRVVHDTKYLRAFHAVCEAGGFGRAAARLHCTQPAVSYQVRALERDFGTPLFSPMTK